MQAVKGGLMLLVADVGGTKTAVAVFSNRAMTDDAIVDSETYRTKDFESLIDIIRTFIAKYGVDVEQAVFGVPGPVIRGRCVCTNLPWDLSEEDLKQGLGFTAVELINDQEAMAKAIPELENSQIETVQGSPPTRQGTIGIIAPGTGLGEAFLTWDGAQYRSQPSEGGHTDFAAQNDLQWNLASYLKKQFGHVSYERVCSGSGVPNLFNFFRDFQGVAVPSDLEEELRTADDMTALIFSKAADEAAAYEICRKTVDLFVEILAAKIGNFALTIFATGGIYLAGGIPPHITDLLSAESFLKTVQGKGRIGNSRLLQDISIHVVKQSQLALIGLANAATQTRGFEHHQQTAKAS